MVHSTLARTVRCEVELDDQGRPCNRSLLGLACGDDVGTSSNFGARGRSSRSRIDVAPPGGEVTSGWEDR